MNPYQKLFLICDSADQFIEASNDPTKQEEFIQFCILGCLLSAEEILDKGRNVASNPESPNRDDKNTVNQRMDKLRGDIVVLLKKLSGLYGREKVVEYLHSRTRSMGLLWVNSF